jgi:cell fate regulator YaaT (PSP1 superfamily)
MDIAEYLVSYGRRGDFGRFRPVRPLACRRGDRVVIRTSRGLEVGEVLREATERHARFLPNTSVSALLRSTAAEDERQEEEMRRRAGRLYERGRDLAAALSLPLELLDAEVLLDGANAVLHQLRWAECDVRPFVSTLSREFEVQLALAELAAPAEEKHPGCGHCGPGGCGSCGSGGGCGSCGSARPEEVRAYFAGLRQQMEHRHSLL